MNDNENVGVAIVKLIATAMTWGMATLMLFLIQIDSSFFRFLSIAVILIPVVLTNLVIWGGGAIFSDSGEQGEKRKNTNTELESALMLLQMLDSNERDVMKKRLLNSTQQEDGELGEIIESTSRRH